MRRSRSHRGAGRAPCAQLQRSGSREECHWRQARAARFSQSERCASVAMAYDRLWFRERAQHTWRRAPHTAGSCRRVANVFAPPSFRQPQHTSDQTRTTSQRRPRTATSAPGVWAHQLSQQRLWVCTIAAFLKPANPRRISQRFERVPINRGETHVHIYSTCSSAPSSHVTRTKDTPTGSYLCSTVELPTRKREEKS